MGPNVEEQAAQQEERIEKVEKEAGNDSRRPIVSPVPDRPTDDELREHNGTHSPPTPWCPHCVRGTASNDPRRRRREEVLTSK